MKISVICPTFNSSKFIDKTLNSILSQNFNKFEVLFSDDGSEDNTVNILEDFKIKFKAKGIECKIIKNKHMGPGAARNAAIKISQYDWLAFIDSDDIWNKNKLKNVNNAFEKSPDLNCIIHRQFFKNKKGKIKSYDYDKYYDPYKPVFNQLFKSNFIATSSVVIKKDLILKHQGFDETLQNAQDYDLWLKIGNDFKILIIKDYLGTYVERDNSITSRPYQIRLKNVFKILIKYKKVSKTLLVYRFFRLIVSNQWFK